MAISFLKLTHYRLDKALVLMKAGFKMAKKAVKEPGHTKRTDSPSGGN